jgi:hypothetical protein
VLYYRAGVQDGRDANPRCRVDGRVRHHYTAGSELAPPGSFRRGAHCTVGGSSSKFKRRNSCPTRVRRSASGRGCPFSSRRCAL